MIASEVLGHFRSIGSWVNWADTVDRFLCGDPEAEVRGMAVMWIPTPAGVRQALALGANLLITHEPAFYTAYRESPDAEARRRRIEAQGVILLRCHDTWDRMPEIGIPAAWARTLGFPVLGPDDPTSYYRLLDVPGRTVDALAGEVAERVRPLGETVVTVHGEGARPVSRMAIGTGAITDLRVMKALGADVLLATEDGATNVNGTLWALEADVPLLRVNHAVAEFPGLMALARHLAAHFPDVRTTYVPVEYPGRRVMTSTERRENSP